MDINEFMKRSLAAQEKTVELLTKLVEQGEKVVNIDMRVPADVKKGLEAAKETAGSKLEEKEPSGDVVLDALDRAAAAKDESPFKDSEHDVKPAAEAKPKKVTADDARAALKAYAKVEGNEAAMELLNSLGAASITALAEQGAEKLAELVEKCREVAA